MSKANSLVFVVGPTACGKSALALASAKSFGGCILNADSVQAYSSVQIGAAKPTSDEQKQVPHFLLGHVPEGERYTAGQFRAEALKVIARQIENGPIFVVGGSGFYLQALEKGMYLAPAVSAEIAKKVREDMATMGPEKLWKEVAGRDPGYAERLAKADTYRIQRALEILRSQKESITAIEEKFRAENQTLSEVYPLVKVGLKMDREALRLRVRERVKSMLADGLLAEVQNLISTGLGNWAPLQSVGYKECVAHLKGELSQEELTEAIVTSTMQLAKRQMTWFRRDPEIQWFDSQGEMDRAKAYIENQLSSE